MSGLKLNPQEKAVAGQVNNQPGSNATPVIDPDQQFRATIPVLSADLQGIVTGCNAATPALFGWEPREILGKTLTDLVLAGNSAEKLQFHKSMLASLFQAGNFTSPCEGKSKAGGKLTAEICVALLRDDKSAPTGMVALFSVAPKKGAGSVVRPDSQALADEQADQATHTVSRGIEGSPFIVASPLMHKFIRMVDRVAGHTETVLITGETGTGKELIARTIHQSSHRRSRPWIDINCAALPENLVESELFGYEKGAFTGADVSKPGLFELADRGTLFLDEIGELQLHTQVKLLRVLDGYPFYRLGGHRKIKVDVRIVAATNQDLEAAVTAGRFRHDLYHRLGQFQLRVPPLRERPEDIVALAEHFLNLKARERSFAPDAVTALLSYSWPGNVRELRNLIARVAVQATQKEIPASQIADAMSGSPTALRQAASMPVGNLESMEEQMIIRALERSGGHRGQGA
ncbi:MAG: sigma 54-interacting transcriptional regulator, partial [Candidatus Sulfotelmatobacter sp.]